MSASRAACAGASRSAGIAASGRLAAAVGRKRPRLHRDEIDDAAERLLFANRQLQRHDRAPEHRAQRLERSVEARALAVEPIQHDDARHLELLGGRPDFLGRDLDAGDSVDDDERAIRDAQRRARVAQEVRHAGRVDEIDLVLVPLDVGEAAGQRVLPRDFLFVVIGDRRPVVHAPEAVHRAGIEQQRRDELRLAGAAVADQGDVSDAGAS